LTREDQKFKVDVPSLDLLRGLMPGIVFLSHAVIWTGCIPELRPLFMAGGLAVDVFIFISGFLMLWHYLDREKREPWNNPESWRKFWLRRFFRMTPLYWMVLTLVFIFHRDLASWTDEFHVLYPPPWMDRLPEISRVESGMGWANILSHYTYLFGFIPKYASNNPLPDWSIALEMQFYLVFPFLALAIRRFGWIPATVVILAIWLVAVNRIHIGLLAPDGPWGWFPMPTFLPLRIGVFLCGMLAAGAIYQAHDWRRFLCFFATSVAIALWHYKWLVVPVAAFYGWEWLCRAGPEWQARTRLVDYGNAILRSRPVAFIADCSYGVYLWHIPVQLCMMRMLQDGGWFANKQPMERMVLLTATALPVVYGVAWITFRLVERPGISLGKRLLRHPKSR
jgi:peptidoglycan/LPS O-acetylase OafA/YrhL